MASTELRAAAQQALEALTPWMGGDASHTEQYAAYHALRSALAQQAEPVEPDLSRCPQCGGPADNGHDRSIPPSPYFCTKCMAGPVPVAWMHVPYPGSGLRQMVSLIRNREPSLYAATVPLFIAPPQRPAEPVQEPVALDWLHKWANQDDGEPETQWHEGYEAARRVVQIHLTAPPQRKPLTEEEIEKAYRKIWRDLPSDFDHTSAGWIEMGIKYAERAHGIGGQP